MDQKLSPLIQEFDVCNSTVKKCIFCQSIYIDDVKCESCGRYFHQDGKDNFFELKERFLHQLPELEKLYPWLEKKNRKSTRVYVLSLKRRLDFLLTTFSRELPSQKKKLNLFEIKQILEELNDYAVDLKSFMAQERYEDFPYLTELNMHISDLVAPANIVEKVLDLKLADGFKLRQGLRLVTMAFIVLLCTYYWPQII